MNIIEQYKQYLKESNQFMVDKEKLINNLSEPLRSYIKKDGYLLPRHLTYDELYDFYIDRLNALSNNEFIIDDDNRYAIEKIVLYMNQNPKFKGSLDKGLMIRGPVGAGKTLLFKGMQSVYSFLGNNILSIIDTYDVAARYLKTGPDIFYDEKYRCNIILCLTDNLIFDDIGVEPVVKYMGSEANVMAEIIYRRYKSRLITHFSSNLDSKILKEIYGERIVSRLKEMCNNLILKGNDRRI